MRMAFGLVSLLVTLAIILFIFKYIEAPTIKEGKKAQDTARQMAGRDEEGQRVTDAVTLDSQDRAGKMESVVVSDIKPNSALQQRYGLQKGDVILEMGELSVRGYMNSPDEAKDFLLKAYQENRNLVVIRGWDKLTLPMNENVARAAAAKTTTPGGTAQPAPGAQADATPPPADSQKPAESPKPRDNRGALERQLDLIKDIPGQ
jgi:hypothetical protein